MVFPESARFLSVPTRLAAAVLSSPEVGSSRKITDGLEISSHAIASRRRSPPDIPRTLASPTIVSAAFSSFKSRIKCSIRSAFACFEIKLPSLSSTRKASVSLTVMNGKKLTSCFTKAAGICDSPVIGYPLTYLEPSKISDDDSLTFPASACMTEDFPAPLGPIIANIRPGWARPRILPFNMSRCSLFLFFDFSSILNPSNPRSILDIVWM
mmetsp:Transcript_12686/g.29981  ORF Transcript_12686/g.29981 Transcript_12686/m.29981 type:complete len:211 (+) Transcript_12686:2378-3010(+)